MQSITKQRIQSTQTHRVNRTTRRSEISNLKDVSVFDDLIWKGRLFHTYGAAEVKISDQVNVCAQTEDRERKYWKKGIDGGLVCKLSGVQSSRRSSVK